MRGLNLMAGVGVLAAAHAAIAVPSVDGTADAEYGAALAVQNTQTGFGNANTGNALSANGSELDQAFGVVSGGSLFIVLAGNLETNFNKLDIFIDSATGGQNQLRGDNPNVDFNGLNRMGNDGSGNGLTFDAAFASDHWVSITGGGAGPEFFLNYAETPTGGGGTGGFQGGSGAGNGTITGTNGIKVAVNNSNTAGVSGGTGPDSGAGVITGFEFEIPLSVIGNPTGDIRVSAFVNGSGHDFLSNQVLGGIGGGGNLGEPRAVNFNNIAGDQYFTVPIPEPASLGIVAGLAGFGLMRRRQRA